MDADPAACYTLPSGFAAKRRGRGLNMYDVIIIGAGVIGCAIARHLSAFQGDVLVLEKADDVSEGASKANSGYRARRL